jgi:hypothetical protein
VVLVACWSLLVLGGVLLEQRGAPALDTCLLHRLSGHPCPTCGSTRVVLDLVHGAWLEALRLNPLVTLGLVSGGGWLALRLLTGRALKVLWSPRERLGALLLGLAALLANWVWVLRTQG